MKQKNENTISFIKKLKLEKENIKMKIYYSIIYAMVCSLLVLSIMALYRFTGCIGC